MTYQRTMVSSLWLGVLAAAALVGCQPAEEAQEEDDAPSASAASEGVLAGTVLYRERMALPPGATIEVRLQDVSIADAPAVVIAEQTIAAEGRQVPIPFELRYATDRIEPNHRYGVRAEIRAADGNLLFTTTTHYPVLEPAENVELLVERAGGGAGAGPVPPPGGGPEAEQPPPTEGEGGAAQTAPPGVGAAVEPIPGGAWRLVAIQRPGAAEEAVAEEPRYTIEFMDGRFAGQAHCNRYTGAYQQPEGRRLMVGAVVGTLAACPDPSIADEYLRAIGALTEYEMRGDETLRLSFQGNGWLTFARESANVAAAAAPAPGRTFVYAMVTELGQRRTEMNYADPAVEGAKATYRAAADGQEITAVVERAACVDGMSGENFEARAAVSFEGTTFRGCGRFL
jgi:putative lipoprotein